MIQDRQAHRTVFMLQPTPHLNQPGSKGVSKHTLGSLFDSEETPLLRYAFSLTGRRAVAEEIVQEVFLQLHAQWDEVEAPKAWLMRCVRNKAFNYVRDSRLERLNGDGRDLPSPQTEDKTPEDLLLRMEATGVLRQILLELSDTDRQLVTLKYFEGLKYREISTQTGLSISNVGYRLHHILKELAEKMRPLGIDEQS